MNSSWRSITPMIALAAIAAALALVYLSRRILVPFLLSAVLAYTLHPAVVLLERRGLGRTASVILVFTGLALAAAGIVAALIPELTSQGRHFVDKLPGYQRALKGYFDPLLSWIEERYPGQVEALGQEAIAAAKGAIPTMAGWLVAGLQQVVTSFVRMIVSILSIVVIPVFAAYLLIDYKEIGTVGQAVIPRAVRPGIERRMAEIDRVLRAWLRGQLTVALCLAVIYSVGLTLLDVPLGLLIGVVGGFANLVPYLGLVVGFAPAAALAFLDSGTWGAPVAVAVVFIVGQLLEATIITPYVMGGEVGLPPALLLLCVLLGGELFGFTGLLLAIPVTAAGLVLLRDLRRSYDASRSRAAPGEPRRHVARPLRRPRVAP